MRRFLPLVAILSSGCYHATIETGLAPSAQTLERRWAHGWVYGLVPPSAVETMERCPNGIARVETQLSFVNQLVGFLTGGIYTPMEIVVTCAAAGAPDNEQVVRSAEEFRRALEKGEGFTVALE